MEHFFFKKTLLRVYKSTTRFFPCLNEGRRWKWELGRYNNVCIFQTTVRSFRLEKYIKIRKCRTIRILRSWKSYCQCIRWPKIIWFRYQEQLYLSRIENRLGDSCGVWKVTYTKLNLRIPPHQCIPYDAKGNKICGNVLFRQQIQC